MNIDFLEDIFPKQTNTLFSTYWYTLPKYNYWQFKLPSFSKYYYIDVPYEEAYQVYNQWKSMEKLA